MFFLMHKTSNLERKSIYKLDLDPSLLKYHPTINIVYYVEISRFTYKRREILLKFKLNA